MWTMMLMVTALAATPTECRLAECFAAVEAFPPEPCAGQTIPRDVRRRVRQVRETIQRDTDGEETATAKPARAVLKWLRRATQGTKIAVAEGKLTGACADVLQGQLRNARACAACPALREMPADRRMLEAS
jgi:hypothetical protein